MSNDPLSQEIGSGDRPKRQDTTLGGNTLGSDEGRMEISQELMETCTSLKKRILVLEEAKIAQDKGRTSDKTKLMFKNSDFDDLDDLVDEGMDFVQEKDAENQGKIGDDDIKVVKGSAKEKGVTIKDVEVSSRVIRSITTLQPLPTIYPKDKGKGILQETKPVEKTKKKVQGDAQIERDAKRNVFLGALLHDPIAQVKRERPITESFEKKSCKFGLQCTSSFSTKWSFSSTWSPSNGMTNGSLVSMVSILQFGAITLVMPLIPTFIASEGSLIVSSSRTPTVSGQMTDPLAVCTFYSAWAIVMKLALVAHGKSPPYFFLFTSPAASVRINGILHSLRPSCHHTAMDHVGQATDIFLNLVRSSGNFPIAKLVPVLGNVGYSTCLSSSSSTFSMALHGNFGVSSLNEIRVGAFTSSVSFLLTPVPEVWLSSSFLFASHAVSTAVTPWSIIA
ncbi:hypothetical protein Tco_1155112 [Tanacetum coccineum]